jgi:hypothetical protein
MVWQEVAVNSHRWRAPGGGGGGDVGGRSVLSFEVSSPIGSTAAANSRGYAEERRGEERRGEVR